MKDGRAQECVDYIRFTMELEGAQLSVKDEETIRNVLDDEVTADEAAASFIRDNGLGGNYESGYDELENYPGTKCLVNYFNIRDKTVLRKAEHFFVNVRSAGLFAHPLKGAFTFTRLKEIHSILFGDLYPSAGHLRRSEASKRKDFCRPEYIEKYADDIFSKLSKDEYLKKADDIDDFVNDLAFYMGEAEALHPFRDGNGRAIRFFFNQLVWNAGYVLHWNKADPDRMLEASIAAIDGDYQALVDVLEEIIEPAG